MSIGVRIGIAVLATVFSALAATIGVEEVFAFGAAARTTAELPAAQATSQATDASCCACGQSCRSESRQLQLFAADDHVAPGTTVIWTNRDDIPHTVVSDDKVFKSKVLDTDEKFSFTFDKAGNFPYFCSVHPKMTGKVIVQ